MQNTTSVQGKGLFQILVYPEKVFPTATDPDLGWDQPVGQQAHQADLP